MTFSTGNSEQVENGQTVDESQAGQTDTNTVDTAATIDVQAQINSALAKQQADFIAELEQATGHKDIKSLTAANLQAQGELQSRVDAYKSKFEQAQIHFAILAESTEAISPAFVNDLLAGKAVCDENGNVTIDGNTVADTVKTLLDVHPFLAKTKTKSGTGSGIPPHANINTARQLRRDDFERLPPGERSNFLSSGGKITD